MISDPLVSNSADNVAAVILAAGNSARMGSHKHLLRLKCGRTMPARMADAAREAGVGSVIVVLGAEADRVASALNAPPPIEIVINADWHRGIGSSIAAGVRAADQPHIDGVLLLLADQCQVTAEGMHALIEAGSSAGVAAACYAGVVGVPAYFDRSHFAALKALDPAAGAQRILRGLRQVPTIAMPEAEFDIDTPADAARFLLTQ
jgi:CTP:molybdopterin cytidylyltransferase MocA